MEIYFFEMPLVIIVVIVTWISCLAVIKRIWTPLKRRFSCMVQKHEPIWPDNQIMVEVNDFASPQWTHDVFLSFRGPDTRKGITVELYNRLQMRGIKTFMDDRDLEVGDAISRTLIAAIEKSRFAIIVLSQDYASSSWCLEELTKICECMKDQNRIFPLFFHVEPSDVRHQKRSLDKAFSKHETSGRHGLEKMQRWRDALEKVASFSGWNTQDYKTHKELVDVIVEFLRNKVRPDAIEFSGDFEAYEATRKAMDEVMKALKDDKVTAVGVYGMGGVGKTSMVKHVGAQGCKNGNFNHKIMAAISQSPNLRKIQGTLADLLGVKLEEETEIGRAATLHKEMMRREKLLIILDDVWERIELSKIGIPSYKELQMCKSKVLLTTRIRNVCHVMRCLSCLSITLSILSKEDSWALFVRNVGMPFESTKFTGVAKKVAGECRGLPIALVAVARALGDKDLAEWEKAAQRLEKSQLANPDHAEDAFKCIRLSYDYLKDEDHKSCFLLCCLYPEDYDIRLENLFKYAIGKGLFRDAETIEEARGTADSVVKYLKDSSLLLDSEKDGCVRMHDVIRDTAMKIAKSEDGHGFLVKAGSGLKDWSCPLHESYSAISLMRNEIRKLPEELVCPNLQILLLKRNADLNEIPEKFIRSLNELRVLDLSNTSISVLPQSFSLLINLQALYLDFCHNMIDISIVGKLKKLEILSMREYPLQELSREIGHLTNLRILDVNSACYEGGGIVTIPSKVISKLHRIEELYTLNCGFEDWGSKVEREGGEIELGFTGLSNLKILQVCISDAKFIPTSIEVEPEWVYFHILIGKYIRDPYNRYHHNSISLVLDTTMSTLPDWFINVVTTKTETLKYDRCKGLSDIVVEYDHGRLHELKHLTVSDNILDPYENMKELMNTTRRVQKGAVFENLEELHLKCLLKLEELCVGQLPPGSLINLKLLHVFFCDNLVNVSKLLQRLPNLEKLYLNCMDEMEFVFGSEGFEPEESKLREINLLDLHALRSICNASPRLMLQSLKSLTIYRCKLLRSLFASDVAECLFQLEDLFVEQCPLLERVIEAVNKKKKVLPKLKNLVLKKLHMLYGATTPVDIECPSLENLIVVDCPQFPFSTSSSLFFAFKSMFQFSISTSASDYFCSKNPVQLNDRQLYNFLRHSWEGHFVASCHLLKE
ncbi:probable disease resistance protein At4g27220 [Rosa rugosa]|uniref:probable disease resistance protein At4g27220 n=1 Tax=Rosa rugosa TaxID=74645 RepID=UPI002B4034DE|nr:probable disease resistance protein At4g27220 [Rosa rugosa]